MGEHNLAGDRSVPADVTLQTSAVAPCPSGDVDEPASNLDVILEQVVKLRTLAVYLNARTLPAAKDE